MVPLLDLSAELTCLSQPLKNISRKISMINPATATIETGGNEKRGYPLASPFSAD
jgi:hypothetical protein